MRILQSSTPQRVGLRSPSSYPSTDSIASSWARSSRPFAFPADFERLFRVEKVSGSQTSNVAGNSYELFLCHTQLRPLSPNGLVLLKTINQYPQHNIEEYVRTDSSGKEFPFLLHRMIEILTCYPGPFFGIA